MKGMGRVWRMCGVEGVVVCAWRVCMYVMCVCVCVCGGCKCVHA